MQQFSGNQEQMRAYMQGTFGGIVPPVRGDGQAEHGLLRAGDADVQSVRAHRPGRCATQDSSKPAPPAWSINPPAAVTETPATPPAAPKDAAIDDLKRKLDELQGQLAQLSKKS